MIHYSFKPVLSSANALPLYPAGYQQFKQHYIETKGIQYSRFLGICGITRSSENRILYLKKTELVPLSVRVIAALYICELNHLGTPDLSVDFIFDEYIENWEKRHDDYHRWTLLGYKAKAPYNAAVLKRNNQIKNRILVRELMDLKITDLRKLKPW